MRQDDYLSCGQYQEHAEVSTDGMTTFQNTDNGKFYFAWLDADGSVLMRSEGYPAIGARDNGVASVRKNREIEARYAVEEVEGKYFTVLKAGNHQEIARSCAYDSEAEALALFPDARAKAQEAARLAAIASSNLASSVQEDSEDDDYIKCEHYKGHSDAPHPDIRTFQHTDGEYYFAVVQNEDNNDLVLRSEGYPAVAPRDNGWQSVLKNRDLPERYSIKEIGTHKFVILKAANHKEIARSCPIKDDASLWALFPLLAPISAMDAEVKEDHTIPAVALGAAAIAGLATQVELPEVEIPEIEVPEVEVPETDVNLGGLAVGGAAVAAAAGFAPEIEVPEVEVPEVEVPVALPVVGAVGAAALGGAAMARGNNEPEGTWATPAATGAAASAGGGLGWLKWLLPLLLIVGLLWWLSQNKGCNPFGGAASAVQVDANGTGANGAGTNGEANANGATNGNAMGAMGADSIDVPADSLDANVVNNLNLNHIFFDVDRADLRVASNIELDKLVTILKENETYTTELRAHTDADGSPEYNQALSQRRLDSAKAYLVAKGIEEGRIKGEIFGEGNPVAENNGVKGRQLNRRVELIVKDGSGIDTGISKPIQGN